MPDDPGQGLLQRLHQRGAIGSLGESGIDDAHARWCKRTALKAALQRLALGHQFIEPPAFAAQHVGQYLARRIIPAVVAGHAIGDHIDAVGRIRFQMQPLRRNRLQLYRRARRQLACRDGTIQMVDLGQHFLRLYMPDHHQDCVVGRVPAVVETFEHLAAGLVERCARAQSVVRIGRTLEHRRQHPAVHHVLGTGQVPRHLLLDGAALFAPQRLAVQHAAHAQRADVQRHVDVIGRHGEKVLGDGLLGIGIELTAHGAGDIGQLGRRQAGAAAEHHVLLRMGHAGETGRRLVGADQIVELGGHHRRQIIAHNHHAQTVVQRRAQHAGAVRRVCIGTGLQRCQRQAQNRAGHRCSGTAASIHCWLSSLLHSCCSR